MFLWHLLLFILVLVALHDCGDQNSGPKDALNEILNNMPEYAIEEIYSVESKRMARTMNFFRIHVVMRKKHGDHGFKKKCIFYVFVDKASDFGPTIAHRTCIRDDK